MIVVVQPLRKCGAAFLVRAVEAGVRPFAEQRLDKPLGFAVGLRPIGSGDLMADAQPASDSPEAGRLSVTPAAVGHDPLNPDPLLGKETHRLDEELDDRGGPTIRPNLGKGEPRGVINRYVDDLIAGAAVLS